jgi:hypothetical protein
MKQQWLWNTERGSEDQETATSVDRSRFFVSFLLLPFGISSFCSLLPLQPLTISVKTRSKALTAASKAQLS